MASHETTLTSPAASRSAARRAGWQFWAHAAAASPRVLAFVTLASVSLGVLPLYEPVWWWDIVMHATCSACIVAWAYRLGVTATAGLAALLAVSAGWELLELAVPNYALIAGGALDTAGDFASNVAGWGVATLVRQSVADLGSMTDRDCGGQASEQPAVTRTR
ncbi:hypothetical protein [Haloferax marisrubri]|uniref:hypothetical protein n=1 Tax=Haloferax marisrubri TaxID=1544719 RepID=UPI0018EA3950|nr:hypothetical protein [Haloferax marisrubri]